MIVLLSRRVWRRWLARALVGVVAGWLGPALVVILLSLCGLGFQGAAGLFQWACLLTALGMIGLPLLLTPPPPPRAIAGQHLGAPRRQRMPAFLPALAAATGLVLLWLGVAPARPQDAGDDPPALLLRCSLAGRPPGESVLAVRWANPDEVQVGPLAERDAGAEKALALTGCVFRALDPGNPTLERVTVGAAAWPLLRPGATLPTASGGLPAERLALAERRLGRLEVAEGPRSFPLGRLVLNGPAASLYPDLLPRIGEPGVKPLLGEAVRMSDSRPLVYHWVIQPCQDQQRPLRGLPEAGTAQDVNAYALLVNTIFPKPSSHTPRSVNPMYPVLAVAYEAGQPIFYLPELPADANRWCAIDTLGEAGGKQGHALLRSAASVWLCRTQAVSGGFGVPARALHRRPARWLDLPCDRLLPAPTPVRGTWAAHLQHFPTNLALGLTEIALLGGCLWRWWGRGV